MNVVDDYKSDYWNTPKMWQGSTVYVLGGGSSLLQENLSLIHGERVIGVNDAFVMGDWVDMVWFGDPRWYEWNEQEMIQFGGLKACCCEIMRKVPSANVKVLDRGKKMGLEERAEYISFNYSSGGSAVNLATKLGANRVVLLGFDMKPDKDGQYWWHDRHHVKKFDIDPYPRFIEAFEHIGKEARGLGIEIVNSTMCSLIPKEFIPKMPLEEVIEN